MSGEMKHARLPWKTHMVDSTLIVDAAGNEIAKTVGNYDEGWAMMETNASHIVRAVNSLSEVTEALRSVERQLSALNDVLPNRTLERYEKYEVEFSGDAIAELRDNLTRARNALTAPQETDDDNANGG